MENGITQEQFTVDVVAGRAECPGGQTTTKHTVHADGSVTFRFDAVQCQACPLRAQCCTGKGGRTITRGPHYAALQAARARQKTDEFKQCYKRRGGVEGGLSALVRGHGIRVCWYLGKAKNNLRALFVGAAVNLRRAARWLAGIRPQVRRKGLGLAG
jgi:transposase